ncbi:class I adenylate-forming enzyme family protein [Brevibacterium rongguiense]|uniref:class I adenylate-forming enzyme family protein n=1 Tax=Brevibacterium rongguiense TaxID=2695267 RepID=UPI002E2D1BC0|nr:AMP-binding protein [Brevibacterium rongguiense]
MDDRVRPHGEHLPIVLTCGERDFAVEQPEAVFGPAGAEAGADTGRQDFLAALEAHRGQRVPHRETSPDDPGIIGYTSGTSGRSKGALVLQRGLAANAQMLKVLRGYGPDSAIFALAPVFHITGFVCLFLAAVAAGARLVLNGRFEPATALALFRTERPTYMAGPATAYLALLAHPDFQGDEFDSFDEIMSGGAPLPEGVVRRFEDRTGYYIGQGYGLTETTAQCIVVPRGLRAPVDPDSGNLSCGLPLASTVVRVLDDEGAPVGPGEVGEICVRGPMVVREYINNPEATAREIPDGELHTGDVGFMDADGWVFIVDRKKDMINASGYKVWPREVEDVLFTHPAVQEAAVVGVPDDYRGESVAAFVTLHRGAQATEREIIDYCREHLASYKAPRTVTFIDELPKTASGKVLRREIRADAAESADAAEPVDAAESAPGAGA